MARWQQWPVIDGAYADDARPWSCQDTCNWLPTPAEQAGTRSPVILRTPPGLAEFCDLGTDAPIRGSHDVEGLLLVVSDNTLFRVSTTGVATAIGTIPGVGRVSMDHTPRGAGFHVGIANGQSGYIYDTATDTLTQITDEGFPGATIFQFIDGYLAFLEPFGKFWGHSELNDGLNYNTLDRYTAESAPDGIKSLIVSHREVFTPGDRSGEFFRNTGAATGTFARADGYEMERGIASPYAITRVDNTLAWLGDNGIAYKLEGHQPVRISNGAIEQAFARSNLANAFAFTWEDKGHQVVYFTLPDGHTWGWDAWTGKWHRRQSYGLNRWRLATLTRWNGQWIGGDYTNGKLYTLTWDEGNVHEDGAPLISERTFPVAHDVGNELIINGIRLFFDTGGRGPNALTLGGDLGDGVVGDTDAFTYTTSGAGVTCSLDSGALPDGLTLNPDCTVTGTRTSEGTDSWVVKGTDAFGNEVLHPDTATTIDPVTWLLHVVSAGTSPTYAGKYSGDTWTLASANTTISGQLHYGGSGQVHVANRGASAYRYSADYGVTWQIATGWTWSSGGGRMLTTGGFNFICGGVNVMNRAPVGSLVFTQPSADTNCRAESIVLHGTSRIVIASRYNTPASFSTDNGATWAQGSDISAVFATAPVLGSNGSTLIACFNDGTGSANVVRIKRSIDGGSTWSAALYTFPGAADASKNVVDVLAHGENWVAVTSSGQVAHSDDDGVTWTLSATTLPAPFQVAMGTLVTAPRLMAACAAGVLMSSDDMGDTWQTRTDPAGAFNIEGAAWLYP